jgi:hypothetical protein
VAPDRGKNPIFHGWLVVRANSLLEEHTSKQKESQFPESCNLATSFEVARKTGVLASETRIFPQNGAEKRADLETRGQPYDEGAALRSALLSKSSSHLQCAFETLVASPVRGQFRESCSHATTFGVEELASRLSLAGVPLVPIKTGHTK